MTQYRVSDDTTLLVIFVEIHISLLAKDTMHVSNGWLLDPYLQILINQLP
jgi:hypothetical protein